MVEAEYNSLITSGKAKMTQKNYIEAKADFVKAQEMNKTLEIERLIDECEVESRKALYDTYMPFGPFTIVKKKSNNRYGAIDNNGVEKIPCIYLDTGPTADGRRAFELENHLYDIYDTSGERKGIEMKDYK